MKIARIERIGRDASGRLSGFQRPQIASHIREISDYLSQPDAMLPNAVVLAFAKGCSLAKDGTLVVDISQGPPGWVVDGQQRLCAALTLPASKFEFLVSSFLCDDLAELNRQFILVNNTRPISKPLIYELLPGLDGLPHRLSDRAGAALLTESLNYGSESSLRGQINQQTHPEGILKDTVIQRLLLNSLQQGALRNVAENDALLSDGVSLVSAFFAAVQRVFEKDWKEHTPKTSRLLHGVGLISMGYVMDEIAVRTRARTKKQFEAGLEPLVGKTRWTSGEWNFGSERRPWNGLQNTKSDYRLVSHYLVRLVRRALARNAA
jgi:DGQHR domain-containing protein